MWTLLKWRANGEIGPPTAAEIITAEKAEHDAKTARLREARLAKEALEPPPFRKRASRPRGWP